MQNHCDLCGNTRWRTVRGKILERCSCYENIQLDDSQLREMNLPRKWSATELADYIPVTPAQSKALDLLTRCSRYVENHEGTPVPFGVLLTGRPGVGKTHLAVGLLKGLRRIGFQCTYLHYVEWLGMVRKEWLESQSSGPADPMSVHAIQEIHSVDVILLDDVAAVPDLPAILTDVPSEFIRIRHNQMKTLILTSRLPLEAAGNSLTHEWGYPTISRLTGMCAVVDLH